MAHLAGRSPAVEVCASEASDNLRAVVSSPLPLVSAAKHIFLFFFFPLELRFGGLCSTQQTPRLVDSCARCGTGAGGSSSWLPGASGLGASPSNSIAPVRAERSPSAS